MTKIFEVMRYVKQMQSSRLGHIYVTVTVLRQVRPWGGNRQ